MEEGEHCTDQDAQNKINNREMIGNTESRIEGQIMGVGRNEW